MFDEPRLTQGVKRLGYQRIHTLFPRRYIAHVKIIVCWVLLDAPEKECFPQPSFRCIDALDRLYLGNVWQFVLRGWNKLLT